MSEENQIVEIVKATKFLLKSNFKSEIKKELIRIMCSKFSELNGKYGGCKLWSKGAFDKYKSEKGSEKKKEKGLRHEHAIPVKELRARLLKNTNIPEPELTDFFKRNCIGVVVTAGEHKGLIHKYRSGIDPFYDVWARYKEYKEKKSGFKVFIVDWVDRKNPKESIFEFP